MQDNQQIAEEKNNETHKLAKEITEEQINLSKYDGKEHRSEAKQAEMNKQLYDLVEYVKWITNETTELRKRLRKAEKIINDLRKSGEASVDTMINTLL